MTALLGFDKEEELKYLGFKLIPQQLDELREFAANPRQRVPYGLDSFDVIVGGAAAGEVHMILARSFAGKSMLCTWCMASNPDVGILFFSLEMPAHQVLQRLYSQVMGVNARHFSRQLRRNTLPENLSWLANKLPRHVIIDDGALGLTEMGEAIERYGGWFGRSPDLVIIDYLEEVGGSKASGEGWMKTEAVASQLKNFAKRYRVPILLVHQAKKDSPTWHPMTEDSAKGAGYTESDVVMGLWRPGRNPDLDNLQRVQLEPIYQMNIIKNRVNGRLTIRDIEYQINEALQLSDLDIDHTRRFYREEDDE